MKTLPRQQRRLRQEYSMMSNTFYYPVWQVYREVRSYQLFLVLAILYREWQKMFFFAIIIWRILLQLYRPFTNRIIPISLSGGEIDIHKKTTAEHSTSSFWRCRLKIIVLQ